MSNSDKFTLDREQVFKAAKPLFYGFMILTAFAMIGDSGLAGTMLGIGVMALIAVVSSSLADSMNDDWSRFLDIISIVTLLSAVLASSYMAALLSFTV